MNTTFDNIVITRNGVALTLGIGKYGKLSPMAGQPFPYPVIGGTPEARQEFIVWAGESDFWENVQTDYRRDFADLLADHLEKHDGVVNIDDLTQEYTDFTSGRQSLAKVKEELEMLYDRQSELVASPELELDEAGKPITESAVKLLQEIRSLKPTIATLKEKRSKIEAEYQRRADKRAATKAAKEAK